MPNAQSQASQWFRTLRDQICAEFEKIETELTGNDAKPGIFERKIWTRPEGGGGEISLMRGRVFEKVGVNISTVEGEFSEAFRKEIPGAEKDPKFWASGISLVAHMASPLVPAVHMNTRFIVVGSDPENPVRSWFGGGADLNPMRENVDDTRDFHAAFKVTCDAYDPSYYEKFKAWCDDYFWIKHRNESRGVGGIFYDYLDTDFEKHFSFTQDVGKTFLTIYPEIVRRHMYSTWTEEDRAHQLMKRGRYAEFNLLYDRGTRFGLMTNGNPEAILMSLPPMASW